MLSRLKGPWGITLSMALLFLIFNLWYTGCSGPLTVSEKKAFLSKLEPQTQTQSKLGEPLANFKALTEFVNQDDGKPFHMINLIRFRKQANYPDGKYPGSSIAEANKRFSKAMLPILLGQAAHPVWVGTPGGAIINPSEQTWDRFALVRYRSRRDFLNMLSGKAFNESVIHKWASVTMTLLMPAATELSDAGPRSLLLILLGVLGLGLHLIFGRFKWYQQ